MPGTTPMRERLRKIISDCANEYGLCFDDAVDAILSELENPTPEMVEEGMRGIGKAQVAGANGMHEIMAAAFTAAIHAAKEGK